ncbi:MAG: 3-hydroxyacyl-CoA dehydrogenase family protein, partial [Pseudomonadota bacterium]
RPPRRHAPPLQRIPGWASLRPFVGAWLKRRVALKADSEHYPAPFMLVDHWRRHANQPVAMYDGEMHDVARLLNGRTGRNLVRVFMLQEMLKGQVAAPFTGQRVHVIGGGVMGGDIAAWCALRGLRVTLQDRTAEQLGPAFERAHALFARRLKEPHRVRAAMDRLVPDLEGRAVSRADVVIEAIFEDAAVKQALFRELEPRLGESALLATNTSSIPLEMLGEGLKDPRRLVGLHFFNPVARMPLVEVVCTAETRADMRERALGFARRIDKLPLVVKSSPGFLVNRILVPYLLEAVAMVNEGLPAPLVDKAAVTFGMPVGPVELADRVGLDICLAVAEKLAAPLDIEVPGQLRKKVDARELGRKSGQGFYPWRNGRARKPDVRQPDVNLQTLQDRLILRMLNEALGCWRDGIVESQDQLDAGVIFGTGFAPFRGGPLHYVRQAGLMGIRDRLNELESRFGVRFSPDPGWGAL